VVLADGETLAVPWGSAHALQTELPELSAMESEVAVPPVICHDSVDGCPEVTVLGDALKLNVKGTVMVRVCGAVVPPGPVAVME
jgi:hypothetical protein